MSFSAVMNELPAFTIAERQCLVLRALELDDPPLPPEQEAIVLERLEAHRRNPASAVPLQEMKARLRGRFAS